VKRGAGGGEAVSISPAMAAAARQRASEKMKSCFMI
jgi:hypothetical protein